MYPVRHEKLNQWVREVADLCEPASVYWCDGSKAEYDTLMSQMVKSGMATELAKRPNCHLFRSDPSDVARVEARTFIGTDKQEEAGPTNNWIQADELKKTMTGLYKGCMHGRRLRQPTVGMPPHHLHAGVTEYSHD